MRILIALVLIALIFGAQAALTTALVGVIAFFLLCLLAWISTRLG